MKIYMSAPALYLTPYRVERWMLDGIKYACEHRLAPWTGHLVFEMVQPPHHDRDGGNTSVSGYLFSVKEDDVGWRSHEVEDCYLCTARPHRAFVPRPDPVTRSHP